MRRSLAGGSMVLFGLSVLLLITLTAFEAALLSLSPVVERVITFLLLVVPAGIGAVFGALSLGRPERPRWMGIAGLVLNAWFSLFHLMIILFAG